MDMEDEYGMADLRQYMNGRPHFPGIPPLRDIFSANLAPPPHHQHHHYEMILMDRHQQQLQPGGLHHHHDQFGSDSATNTNTTTTTTTASSVAAMPSSSTVYGLEMEGGALGGGEAGTARWPRQETLTLLEIRSRLDSKFKEANQKGPLWDEVSRIMSEEHGYQRSGKKCREKFENLYKYYKKTKEGKAGRQDGKHYRFFRQLEALYGDANHPASVSETHLLGNNFRFQKANQESFFQAPKLCDSLGLSNSSETDTSSSEDYNDVNAGKLVDSDSAEKKKKRGRRSWKAKVRDFIDLQMKKLMEKQEEWLEKMMKTFEKKEQERVLREQEWRKQEADRIEREHEFWANERAWIEARDAALMETLQKLTGNELVKPPSPDKLLMGPEAELQRESINNYLRRKEGIKKFKENSRSFSYFLNNESSVYNQGGGACYELNEQNGGTSPPTLNDGCFNFLVGADHGNNPWENYGVKLRNEENP